MGTSRRGRTGTGELQSAPPLSTPLRREWGSHPGSRSRGRTLHDRAARLGADITVGDVSPVQLRLNREKVAEVGCEQRIVDRVRLDITDLSRFPDRSFDGVVCYGGPLSYVFDRADDAMAEMLRVTRSGGSVLLSVMSLAGATRRFLGAIFDLYQEVGIEEVRRVAATGDQHGVTAPDGDHCHMYRWEELEALLEPHPCEVVAASAANFLSVQNQAVLEEVERDPLSSGRPCWSGRRGSANRVACSTPVPT